MIKHLNNAQDFEKEVKEGLVLVDFYADWCGPCRMLAPVLEEISKQQANIKFVSVNVDENPTLSERFGVFSIPCVVFIKGGKEISRSVGFMPKSDLENFLKDI